MMASHRESLRGQERKAAGSAPPVPARSRFGQAAVAVAQRSAPKRSAAAAASSAAAAQLASEAASFNAALAAAHYAAEAADAAAALAAANAAAAASAAPAAAAALEAPASARKKAAKRKRDALLKNCTDAELAGFARTRPGSYPLGVDLGDRNAVMRWLADHQHLPPGLTLRDLKSAAALADAAEHGAYDEEEEEDEMEEGEVAFEAPSSKRRIVLPQHLPSPCRHCQTVPTPVQAGKVCSGCGLWPQHGADDVINKMILARAGVPASAGQSSDTLSSSVVSESTPKLSANDRELERLAAEGEDWPRFALTEPLTSAEALKQERYTYRGAQRAQLSLSLLKLIRSGRFSQLSLALPRDAAAAAVAEAAVAGGRILKIGGDGLLSTHAALTVRPLTDLGELMEVFFCSIAPALYDRPRALLDWMGLMSTALTITRLRSFGEAIEYIGTALGDKIPQREPFHDYDARILEESRSGIMRQRGFAGPAGYGNLPPIQHPMMGGHPHQQGMQFGLPGRPQQGPQYWREGVCREWNYAACPDPCRFGRQHRCCLTACGLSNPHRAATCVHKAPAPEWTPRLDRPRGGRGRGGSGSGGGSGGGRGGRGGRGGAGGQGRGGPPPQGQGAPSRA